MTQALVDIVVAVLVTGVVAVVGIAVYLGVSGRRKE